MFVGLNGCNSSLPRKVYSSAMNTDWLSYARERATRSSYIFALAQQISLSTTMVSFMIHLNEVGMICGIMRSTEMHES